MARNIQFDTSKPIIEELVDYAEMNGYDIPDEVFVQAVEQYSANEDALIESMVLHPRYQFTRYSTGFHVYVPDHINR